MNSFGKRFMSLVEDRKSILCVGLDPALPEQRSMNVIPSTFLINSDENEARLDFCLDIIEKVKDYSVAVKPNQQYVFGFTKQQHQRLTKAAKENGMLSILDYKLNDIGDTIESAIYHLARCGYDAVTFNPLPGNLEEAVELAHESVNELRGYELGLIVLTLMSNPEAVEYMKQAELRGKPMYISIAEDVKKYGADGCVVGATGHVTEADVRSIRTIVGGDRMFLVPGVGAQKGDPRRIIAAGGENILINVGRDIVYSQSPTKRAEEYSKMLNQMRIKVD